MFVLLTLAAQLYLHNRMYFTGDEPHYVLSTISFLRDGDFDLYNNFKERHFKEFWAPPDLIPQVAPPGAKFIPAEHGTAFPLIIALPYAIGGVRFIRLCLIAGALAACFLVAAAADRLASTRAPGTAAGLLLAISPTWQMQSSRIYPEIVGGTLVAALIWLLANVPEKQTRRTRFWQTASLSFIAILLPVVYMKYGAIAAPLGLTALLFPSVRTSLGTYAGGSFAYLLAVANLIAFQNQGALGGNFTGEHFFKAQGMFARYWAHFFDEFHGFAVTHPYGILLLWPMFRYLRGAADDQARILRGLAYAALLFTLLHGFWTVGPGSSISSRYFTALLPVACTLIACWAFQPGQLQKIRLAAVIVCGSATLVFWFDAVLKRLPPYYAMADYRHHFPRFWDNFEYPDLPSTLPLTFLPFYAMAALVGTKLIGLWLEKKPDLRRTPSRSK